MSRYPVFFGPYGATRSQRREVRPDTTEGKFLANQMSEAQLRVIAPDRRNEFLEAEMSADPIDRQMAREDPRGYFSNGNVRKEYKQLKQQQLLGRATTIVMSGEELLQAGQGDIINLGNGKLVCRNTVTIEGSKIRKGDMLECINDRQVFNLTAMKDQKKEARLAERYQLESARDAYRHPHGLTTPAVPATASHMPTAMSSSVKGVPYMTVKSIDELK